MRSLTLSIYRVPVSMLVFPVTIRLFIVTVFENVALPVTVTVLEIFTFPVTV
jgi:hypothetical protein